MDLSNENVIHVKKGNVQYLQFRRLLEYKDIISHAYSLGTNMNFRTATTSKQPLEGAEKEQANTSYKLLANAIGSKYENLVKASQMHTDNVQIVDKKLNDGKPDFNTEKYKATDGLITNKKNLLLTTTNADCILLLFFDPVKKVIANVHSGWRGTLQRISVKTVEKMQKEFDCNPEDIICCICPSIRKCHFEVEEDVEKLFGNEFKEIEKNQIIEETIKNKKWHIDTVLINQIILEKAGLKKKNIIDSKICSVCNPDLIHSYRVEKEGYGLSTALIEIK
ncbi:MAG: peptidoglycan editing factor PgeF [Clostridia bacterium]